MNGHFSGDYLVMAVKQSWTLSRLHARAAEDRRQKPYEEVVKNQAGTS